MKYISYTQLLRPCLILGLIGLMSCNHSPKTGFPGYIEGKYTYISSEYSGLLKALHVAAGDMVKEGQLLFTLDSLPARSDAQAAKARVSEAYEQLQQLKSKLELMKADYQRSQYLLKNQVMSTKNYELKESQYLQAEAQLKSSQQNYQAVKVALEKAQWTAQQQTVSAPASSLVFDVFYNPGERVSNLRPVLSLLEPQNVKVVFFIPETLLSKIKLNQVIEVRCDGCKQPFKAKINYIFNKAEYTPPIIYSNEERAKLVYRAEAVPQVPNPLSELHTGQPVSITIINI